MKKVVKEMNKKTSQELLKEIADTRASIHKTKIEWKVTPPKDTNIIRKAHKKIAVLLTIFANKQKEK